MNFTMQVTLVGAELVVHGATRPVKAVLRMVWASMWAVHATGAVSRRPGPGCSALRQSLAREKGSVRTFEGAHTMQIQGMCSISFHAKGSSRLWWSPESFQGHDEEPRQPQVDDLCTKGRRKIGIVCAYVLAGTFRHNWSSSFINITDGSGSLSLPVNACILTDVHHCKCAAFLFLGLCKSSTYHYGQVYSRVATTDSDMVKAETLGTQKSPSWCNSLGMMKSCLSRSDMVRGTSVQ